MATTVRLSDEMVETAKQYAKVEHRSAAKQIEYWAMLGRAAIENPDLPVEFIRDTLIAMEEVKAGKGTPYKFD